MMKMIVATTLAGALLAAPLAHASGSIDEARQAVDIGADYGITHVRSIELEDDDDDRMEIEGWVDNDWSVELDVNGDGSIRKEERRKHSDGPWGLSAADVRNYIDASTEAGMTRIEEIKVNASGYVEVEGYADNGQELEVDFRSGSVEPVKVERDD